MSNSLSEKILEFTKQFESVSFAAGDQIPVPQPEVPYLYFLHSGSVKMHAVSEDGESVTLTVFRPHSFFPLMLSLSKVPTAYVFEVLESGDATKIPSREMKKFLKENPDILFNTVERFSDALCGLTARIESLSLRDTESRLAGILLYLLDRFPHTTQPNTISLHLTHEDLATWIGVQRETVSREMLRLQKNGSIEAKNRHITILNPEQLTRISRAKL